MNYKYEYEVLSDNEIDMIFNGKVSQKNAIDINGDFLSKIPNLIKPNQTEDSSWQKASASLDASAKIYGFRVDAVHSDTFKILNGLNRNELNENEDIKNTTKAHNDEVDVLKCHLVINNFFNERQINNLSRNKEK